MTEQKSNENKDEEIKENPNHLIDEIVRKITDDIVQNLFYKDNLNADKVLIEMLTGKKTPKAP